MCCAWRDHAIWNCHVSVSSPECSSGFIAEPLYPTFCQLSSHYDSRAARISGRPPNPKDFRSTNSHHTTYNKYIHPMLAKSKVMLTPLQGALVNARDMLARAVPLVYFTILTVRSATTPSVGMSITINPTIKYHADERSARSHSLWLTPVDPGAISPVILCTVVWYWTPLYFFRPAALFTRLSLSTRWRHQTCVTHQW